MEVKSTRAMRAWKPLPGNTVWELEFKEEVGSHWAVEWMSGWLYVSTSVSVLALRQTSWFPSYALTQLLSASLAMREVGLSYFYHFEESSFQSKISISDILL